MCIPFFLGFERVEVDFRSFLCDACLVGVLSDEVVTVGPELQANVCL